MSVDRANPGRVDKLDPRVEQLIIELHAGKLDAAAVGRIASLGHILGQLGQRPLLLMTVVEQNQEPIALARADHRHNRGQRNDPGGEDVPGEQSVDQRALTALELSEDD